MAFKAIGNAIKIPIKKVDNTIKNTKSMFRLKQTFTKAFTSDITKGVEKQSSTRNNVASSSVKYLGKERIHHFKYKVPCGVNKASRLVRTENQKNIQMKSFEQIGGKELKSFINIFSIQSMTALFVTGHLGNHQIPANAGNFFDAGQFGIDLHEYQKTPKEVASERYSFSLTNSNEPFTNKENTMNKGDSRQSVTYSETEGNKKESNYDTSNKIESNEKKSNTDTNIVIEENEKKPINDTDISIEENEKKYDPKLTKKDYQKEYDRKFYAQNSENISNYQRQYYDKNKEKFKERSKIYYNKNKEKIQERIKNYQNKNKEEIAEKQVKYRNDNREEIRKRSREFYWKNKDRLNESKKEYYRKNTEMYSEKFKVYQEKNKEHISEMKRKYYIANKEKYAEYYKKKKQKNQEKLLAEKSK